jgi:hypothetical protein
MTSQDGHVATGSTSSGGAPASDADRARHLSRLLADRIIAIANPETALVVGCGGGLLVQALADKGVDASGIDESDDKISAAPVEVRPRLEVASVTKPLGARYDVVTCLDVLSHLDPAEAQSGIDALCAATDRVVFASAPGTGSARASLFTPSDWVASFAERGFFRRTDVALDFWSPWAVLFERSDVQPRDLVHRYETTLAALESEVREKRAALAAADGEHAQRHADVAEQLTRAQHQALTTRDHVIGLEAEAAQLQAQVDRLTRRLKAGQERTQKLRDRLQATRRRAVRAERRLAEVTGSRAWRIGGLLTGSRRSRR